MNTIPVTDDRQLIQWFRQAMPYINAHRGKTFVVMLGGDAVDDDNIRNIIYDIALLNTLGVRLVIVHGVRRQLDQKLQRSGIESQFVGDLRVSDKQVMAAAIEACSLVRSQLETQLSMGLPNSPMHGASVRVASGNVITAKPAGIIDGIDLQQSGKVRKIDTAAINTLLDLGNVVLLSPLGYSPAGESFSLGYQHLASEIAIALQADKLIAFTKEAGLYDENDQLQREISAAEASQQIEKKGPDNHFSRCVLQATEAVKRGVPRAHLMSYCSDGTLLQELFSVDGAGTLISDRPFEILRTATAEDIPAIVDIIAPMEAQGVLLKRDREKLEAEIHYFTVVEREGLIVALAALYPYPQSGMGEIACIVTHPDYRKQSRGATLLQTLEKTAQEMSLKKIFVLTTQTAHWFLENGFTPSDAEQLPQQKQSLYNYQRNSRVLIKTLRN